MLGKTFVAALFASFALAQHTPVGEPLGNAITRPLNEVVAAGTPFTITWTPTTFNTVSLLFLKGPSTNAVPVGAPIAVGIPNSGSFTWTPPANFGASTGPTGFGIQLIDDVTGQYQYSTQFGISVPVDYKPSSSIVVSTTGGGYDTYPSSTPVSSVVSSAYPTSVANSTSAVPTEIYAPSTTLVASSGYPVANSSVIQPSKPLTIPSSLKTTATGAPSSPASSTTSPPPESTGAASSLRAGLGLAVGVAGLFFML